jgi:hypothetical protein
MAKPSHSNTIVGWREWVALPDLGVDWIKAKIDTGAHTSSIHAFDLVDHGDTVEFQLYPWQDSSDDALNAVLPVHDRRVIRSSSGHEEERIVVLMAVRLVGVEVTMEMTLTNRDAMGFRMLIGREALRQGFMVDPSASFLGGRAPRAIRMSNRGR